MENLDKYPDSPCYNCIVRTTCYIPYFIRIFTKEKQNVFDKNFRVVSKMQSYFTNDDINKCLKIREFLESLSMEDRLKFLNDVRGKT